VFLLLALYVLSGTCYKPVVMYHGYGGSVHDWDRVIKFINTYHPGTPTHSLDLYNGAASVWTNLKLLDGVASAIRALNLTSFHLMCHSQGALVCRNVLQMYTKSNVDTFISLSGPQMGQFGVISGWTKWFPTLTTDLAYTVLYREPIQELFAPANYWNDPFREAEYLTNNLFLPIINNQTYNRLSQVFKSNFVQVNKVALFGGPQDEIIQPWQSAFFGFWDDMQSSIIPMEQQPIYLQDWIGLKTLDKAGKLEQNVVPNVKHMDWLIKEAIFVKYLEPLLT